MTSIDPHIFRAYDIRGKALTQLTTEAALLIGKAFGSVLREAYQKDHPTVVVGRDARTHGPQLEDALVEGLASTGCHIKKMGMTPSPMNYFTICTQHFDGGVHVTASHNPAPDNGLKLQMRDAEAYAGDDLQKLRERIEQGNFVTGEGSVEDIDAVNPYLTFLDEMFGSIGKNMHIVIDSGNGVAGPVYCEVIKKIGAEVTELFTEPDGTFPNHAADPSKHDTLKDLQETVIKKSAQFGLAFDGDGDRMGFVDETGTIKSADELLLLLARDHLSRHKGAPVVFTVSNSGMLDTEVTKWGGKPVMCKVGHSFVEHAMRENHALIGGEQSGHFFCGEDFFHHDDALVAALRVIKILSDANKPASEVFAEFPKVYQSPEMRPGCPDSEKTRIVQLISDFFAKTHPVLTLDGARIDFGAGAWAGIRQSNTSPCLSVCIEARTPEKLREVEVAVLEHMKTYPEIEWK